MKTVLAPNAPWPSKDAEVEERKAHKLRTDDNFEKWVAKQKDVLLTGSMLGIKPKKEAANDH